MYSVVSAYLNDFFIPPSCQVIKILKYFIIPLIVQLKQKEVCLVFSQG